ncbi:MAG: 2-C-methyl-D-erythritol 4-phosphate cytidylyltransferase [Candidatus Cloacimonadaceae bacterium]|nr:2-C-methyl-D-erythritol 4-phosphate cytidylyltransferase [Candidatus Cloacimonadaceae bacterium]MDP3114801.1 2-C-methyl-D-erythritol 4-phosphate cytidylyltransferase [Candidatus Cloacimonadaceae bacterium]
MEVQNVAIVTAAGSGTRMGGIVKKQFRELEGIPILIRTLGRFFASEVIDSVIITAPEEDILYCQSLIEEYFGDIEKPWLVIGGGIERQDSIFGALQSCPHSTRYVFIHDAVRPFVNEDLISDLFEIVQIDKAVIPVARLKHTIKSIDDSFIEQTVPRDRLVQAFTPQVFSYQLIQAAYEKAYQDGFISTDDSSLVEHYGGKVRYLLGSDLNIKITDEADMFFARQIIENNMI